MRALVSGASGFIGKHLVQFLKEQGITVIKLPREVFNDPRHLEPFVKGSTPIDYIFHLASYGNHYHQQDAAEMVQVNYAGTFNLLTATKDINYKAFINVSTSSTLLPYETLYSATKAGGERLVRAFAFEKHKPVLTVRPYSVYGVGEAPFRFIPKVFDSCFRHSELSLTPDPVHDWIYVTDFVKAMWDACQSLEESGWKPIPEVNVGTGKMTSNKEVVKLIEKISGKTAHTVIQPNMRSYDSMEWVADAPWDKDMIQLEEGLKLYHEWYIKEYGKGGE